MKKVLVLSKERFKDFICFNNITDENVESKNICIISINDGGAKPLLSKAENVNVMFFDDTSENELHLSPSLVHFNTENAAEIIQFIEKHSSKDLFIVHCTMGVSRSGAVGTFINDYFGLDYFQFKRNNPIIQPNQFILSQLKQQLFL
jgi:predicted protein tyrosine phosphatase